MGSVVNNIVYSMMRDVFFLIESIKYVQHKENVFVSNIEFNKLEKEIIELNNLIQILDVDSRTWQNLNAIFYSFDILSSSLLKYELKDMDYLNIIMYVIKRNLEFVSLDKPILLLNSKLLKEEYLQYFLGNNLINDGKVKDIDNKILDHFRVKYTNVVNILDEHKVLIDCSSNNFDNMNVDDFNKFLNSLRNIGVVPNGLNLIKNVLEKKVRKNIELENIQANFIKMSNNSKLGGVTDKEYKLIKKELNTYYDFRNNLVLRELTYDEVIYCVSLMLKIGEEKRKIQEFLFKTWNMNIVIRMEKMGVFECFKNELERFKFYQEKYHLQEKVNNMEECLEEMKIAKGMDNSEYCFWENTLLELFYDGEMLLPQEYDYEIHLAKKRLKREEM